MLRRDERPPTVWDRARGALKRAGGEAGAVGVGRRGRAGRDRARQPPGPAVRARSASGSVICFPPTAHRQRALHPHRRRHDDRPARLAVGRHGAGPGCLTDPVVRIGDRCLIGEGSGIVGHLSIEIGDDVWTGHHVYITDQNHGYEDVDLPISRQVPARAAGGRRRRVVAGPRHGGAARGSHRPPRRGGGGLGGHRRRCPTSASPPAPRPGRSAATTEGGAGSPCPGSDGLSRGPAGTSQAACRWRSRSRPCRC